jgi:hypothetical protein
MKYEITSGRTITRSSDRIPVAYVGRIGNDSTGYTLAPAEADELARQVVAALNRPTFTYQVWQAENDGNGNPRRVTLVYGPAGDIVAALDHGYQGDKIPGDAVQLPTVDCTGVAYRDLVRGEEVREVARRYLDREYPTGLGDLSREALRDPGILSAFRAKLRACRAASWMLKPGVCGVDMVRSMIWSVEAQRKAGHAFPADADGKAVWK